MIEAALPSRSQAARALRRNDEPEVVVFRELRREQRDDAGVPAAVDRDAAPAAQPRLPSLVQAGAGPHHDFWSSRIGLAFSGRLAVLSE